MLAAKRRERDAQPLGRQRDELRDLDPRGARPWPSGPSEEGGAPCTSYTSVDGPGANPICQTPGVALSWK